MHQSSAFDGLRKRYVSTIDAHLTQIEAELNQDQFDMVIGLCHQIAGTAAMYGLPELGQNAAQLLAALRSPSLDSELIKMCFFRLKHSTDLNRLKTSG